MPPVGPRPAPPDGTAKVTYRGTSMSTNWENVMWCGITGSLSFSTIPTFATDMYGIFQTTLLEQMSVDAILQECLVTYYDGAGNPQGSISAAHAGSNATAALTAQVSTVLSWKIPASWRGGKPRTYVAGGAGGNIATTSTWSDGYVASMLTSAASFLAGVNAVTLTGVTQVRLGTVSFQHAGAWRTPPVLFEYVGVGVQQRICTQRRRLGKELF